MNTQYYRTRLTVYFLMFAVIVTSCGDQPNTRATLESVRSQAQQAIDARMAAIILVGGQTLQDTAPQLWALEKAINSCPGAFAYFNDLHHMAVFISPGGKAASGSMYFFAAWIDTSSVALVDATRQMVDYGIDPKKINNLEDMINALRSRGFVELTATRAPMLIATLRLAVGFIKSLGGTISDVLVLPVGVFTPEMMQPWRDADWTPGIN